MNQQVCLSGVLKNDACKDSTLILWKSVLTILPKPNNKSCRSKNIPIKKISPAIFQKKKNVWEFIKDFLEPSWKIFAIFEGFPRVFRNNFIRSLNKNIAHYHQKYCWVFAKNLEVAVHTKKICLWSSKKQIIDRYKFRKLCAIFVQNLLPQSSQIQIFVKNITSPAGDSANYLSGTMIKFRISSNPSI